MFVRCAKYTNNGFTVIATATNNTDAVGNGVGSANDVVDASAGAVIIPSTAVRDKTSQSKERWSKGTSPVIVNSSKYALANASQVSCSNSNVL